MSVSHFSPVFGNGTTETSDQPDLASSSTRPFHLHLHLGNDDEATARQENSRPLGRWAGLLVGFALVAAFGGGYQFGRQPAPDDVSNLRPPPRAEYGAPRPPEFAARRALVMQPRGADELPAVLQQLQQQPRIIPPQAPSPQGTARPSAAPMAPSAPGAAAPGTNAFGLEN